MPKIPFRFGEFAPDSEDYENSTLEELENALPIYGGYRSLREAQVKSTVTSASNFVTGSHAHLVTDDVNVQHGKTDDTTIYGDWHDKLLPVIESLTLHEQIDELVPDDDTTFIFCEDNAENPTFDETILPIETLIDPAVAADEDYHLDVRYRGYVEDAAATGTLTVKLYQNTVQKSGQAGDDWVATGDNEFWDGEWKTKRLTLHDTDADSLTDFADLILRPSGTITGGSGVVPDSVSYPISDELNTDEWEDQDGGTDNIYQSIDSVTTIGDTPDDAAYIVTPVGSPASTSYSTKFSTTRFPYGAAIAGGAGIDLKLRLKTDDKDGIGYEATIGSVVTFVDGLASNDTWITKTHNIDAGDIKLLLAADDWDNVPLNFGVAGISDSSEQSSVPTGNGATNEWRTGAWADAGGVADFSDIAAEDSSYISAKGTSVLTYKFTLPAMSQPSNHDGTTKVKVKFRHTGGSQPYVKFKLYDTGSGLTKRYKCETTYQEKVWTLTEAESQGLDWGTAFTMDVIKQTSADVEVRVDYVEIVSEGGTSRFYVGDAWLEIPTTQGFHITWADLIVPSSSKEVKGDKVRIYAGSKERLWEVSDTGWTDRSLAATYGQGSDVPQAWDFCSWGGNVIATNYEDEIQYLDLESGSDAFAKLTTEADDTEYSPRAKFCDIIGNHLVVCNVNSAVDGAVSPAAYTDVFPYTVWWSGYNTPPKFRVGDYANLSDMQHLRQTPGEITGFIGGEFGTLFKRNSIIRQSWVGGNLIFRFDVLARGVGTSHPKSIISVNGDIFFYGHNDFYVMPGGGQPQPVSQGRIKAMLLESFWEERAINRNDYSVQVDNDLRVVGTYDQFTGLIFWCIDNYHTNSDYNLKSDIVVFNPTDGRFGYIRDARFSGSATLGISDILASPNVQQDDVSLLNNLHLFTYDTAPSTSVMSMEKFTGPYYLPMDITTNVVAADSLGAEVGDLIRLQSVRPFYDRLKNKSTNSDSLGSVMSLPYTATIYSSYDQLMIDDVTSATATLDTDNYNKWSALSKVLSGEFWKINLNIPKWSPIAGSAAYGDGAVKTLLGIQLDVQQEGKH